MIILLFKYAFLIIFALINRHFMTENQNYNRIKAVLADKNRTGKWLAQQLGRTENTVSRWCGNKIQPSIVQLNEIAKILEVDVSELLRKTDNVG